MQANARPQRPQTRSQTRWRLYRSGRTRGRGATSAGEGGWGFYPAVTFQLGHGWAFANLSRDKEKEVLMQKSGLHGVAHLGQRSGPGADGRRGWKVKSRSDDARC